MRHDIRRFVERSVEALEREAPRQFKEMCTALSGRRVGIRSGDEAFSLMFYEENVAIVGQGPADEVLLEVDRGTILQLVDGTLTLEDALRQDHLEVRGNVERVAEFYDGLLIYLSGAVRCPQFRRLLTEFRSTTPYADDEVSYEIQTG